jgi:hypothetical protein
VDSGPAREPGGALLRRHRKRIAPAPNRPVTTGGPAQCEGLLFQRNRLLRGQEADPEEGQADTRDPEAGPFAARMKDIRACMADGSSEATSVLQTASLEDV